MEKIEHTNESALVAKVTVPRVDKGDEPLAEIIALATTAGAEVVDSVTQNLPRPHPQTYVGKGKAAELASRAAEFDVDVIITDHDLSPVQERNLEKLTSRKVIDRSQLIMDIFSQRAQTRQAKLQVELAQLRYSLPRLKRMWTHLDRFKAGIGMRGPGEMQLEEDKRMIGRRIAKLKHQLKKLEERHQTSALRRSNEFVVALVGYTNAGKSTLLNRLTASTELVEDKLFATLDTRVRRWHLEDNRYVLLTDTVGFIQNLPPHLVASFHATLAQAREANLLLQTVDASSPRATGHIEVVRRVLRQLSCDQKETWFLYTKWDKVPEERIVEARHLEEQLLPSERAFRISGHTGEGLDELSAALLERLRKDDETVELFIPHRRSDAVAFIQEYGRVIHIDYQTDGVFLEAALSPARLAKFKGLYPEGFPPSREKQIWE